MTKKVNQPLGIIGSVHITAWQKCPAYPDEPWKDRLIRNTTKRNLIVNVGKDTILKGIGGACLTGFGTTAAIGTGDSVTAAGLGNTDLLGTCMSWRDIPSTCKVYVNPTLFVSVDFGYSCNNWTWNELGLADSQGCPSNDPACGALLIARQVDCSPLVKDCTKRAIVEWQLTLP